MSDVAPSQQPEWDAGPVEDGEPPHLTLVTDGTTTEAGETGISQAQQALDDIEPGIPWGWQSLDNIVGPARRGRLVVVGARPSCGKTTLLLNWLNAISLIRESDQPLKILAFFTERHPAVLYRSWAALRLGYDEDAVLANDWDHLPQNARVNIGQVLNGIENIECSSIKLSGLGQPTLAQLSTAVRETQDEFGGLDVLIFDFLQRLRPAGKEDRYRVWAEAAETFASLAVMEHMAVVVGSQLKREDSAQFDKFRPPTLGGFKGASEIEESADVALGLFRPLKKMSQKEERAVRTGELDLEAFKVPDTMAVKVLKHRYRGPAADRLLKLRCARSRVSDYSYPSVAPVVMSPPPPVDVGDAWEEGALPF